MRVSVREDCLLRDGWRCELLAVVLMMQRCLGSQPCGLDRFLYMSKSSLEVPISSRDDFMSTLLHIRNGHQVRSPRRTVPLALVWPVATSWLPSSPR